MEKEEILAEITKFAPHSEVLSLSTLLAVNQKVSVINLSKAGLGKSRCANELLEQMGYEDGSDFNLVSGHVTPYGFYDTLSSGGIIILDESALLLRNNKILDMLLSALWHGSVSWKTKFEDDGFDFKENGGVIIFNTNSLPKNEHMSAVMDRIVLNHFKLTPRHIREKIVSSQTYEPDTGVWKEIRKRVEKNGMKLDNEEENQLLKRLRSPKSVREFSRIKTVARFSKALTGDPYKLLGIFGYGVKKE